MLTHADQYSPVQNIPSWRFGGLGSWRWSWWSAGLVTGDWWREGRSFEVGRWWDAGCWWDWRRWDDWGQSCCWRGRERREGGVPG